MSPAVVPAAQPSGLFDSTILLVALLAVFVGVTVLVATVLGLATRSGRPEEQMRRRLSLYTLTGIRPRVVSRTGGATVLGSSPIARTAVEFAGRVVERRGLGQVMDRRLESAGLPVRTAEWSLIHVGSAVGTTLLLLVLGRGSPAAAFLGLMVGLAGPWAFLVVRESRREAAFLAQLPDTLQLVAGSLQAGYSLPQALDTVVREGSPPMSVEFNRALVESRLGMPVEDALERIGSRLRSRDFDWVVMAIRIQRDVGGNLAELLLTVSETLRERERLRRQVRSLSAEGRLSGWILGALPVVFAMYLVVSTPQYLRPLWTNPLGIGMLVTSLVLLAVGGFWMSRVVKVEV